MVFGGGISVLSISFAQDVDSVKDGDNKVWRKSRLSKRVTRIEESSK
jgi:hypothetical protein